MNRREFIGTTAAGLALSAGSQSVDAQQAEGETLYNGIRLPDSWPPRRQELGNEPIVPPYLQGPPSVIPIDLGRQLFVDDFLIAETTLTRTHHRPRPHADNPVLRVDRPWEREGRGPIAMPYSDGVWYDPRERRFKMWYMAGFNGSVCLALSDDGIRWQKPDFRVRPGTNIVHPGPRDTATVWLDHEAADAQRRYVLVRSHRETGPQYGLSVHYSPDGVHWGERATRSGPTGDRTSVFYNPFRRVWVCSLRSGSGPRRRRYWETRDFARGPQWDAIDGPGLWVGADRLDPMRDDLRVAPQLFALDCVAYESLLIGLFTIWRGDFTMTPGRPRANEICVGYSRDGYHWTRPDRRAFIGFSDRAGAWNWGDVQTAGGGCLLVGEELYFYHSGRAGVPGGKGERNAGGGAGVAVLRRDGFVSMDGGNAGGTLTTRLVRFAGAHLFVNAETADGELTVETLGADGQPVGGLTRAACVPVRGGQTKQAVTWRGATLAAVAGRPVRFRFHVRGGRLYAFWVSRSEAGASQGYVAAGGPGLTNRDA